MTVRTTCTRLASVALLALSTSLVTPSSPATAQTIPAPICVNPQHVTLHTTRTPHGLVSTMTAVGPFNTVRAVRFIRLQNAVVRLNGELVAAQQTVVPAGGPQSRATLQVVPATPGQAFTVAFTVVNACGEWPTFVGMGAGAR